MLSDLVIKVMIFKLNSDLPRLIVPYNFNTFIRGKSFKNVEIKFYNPKHLIINLE